MIKFRFICVNMDRVKHTYKSLSYYYFDRYVQQMAEKPQEQAQSTFIRLLNCIISLVRYPKTVNMDDLNEFADTLLRCESQGTFSLLVKQMCKGFYCSVKFLYTFRFAIINITI